ncbi:MAG: DUF2752 domain-containing protein [Phycisphaerales bacterium]
MPPQSTTPPSAPARPSTRGPRIASALVALACLAVLGLAAWLKPDAAGHGTHTQLGLANCQWVAMFDEPCPTCGMTTSFAYAANADFLHGLKTQPFGFLLALGTATVFWGAVHGAVTNAALGREATRLINGKTLLVAFAMLLAAWVYKLITWTG